jgi:hypothetical protein
MSIGMMPRAINRIAHAGRGEHRFPREPLSIGDFAFYFYGIR